MSAHEFDLPLTDRQHELLSLARRLGRDRFAPRAAAYDAENRFPVENFDDLREHGLLALTIPADHGGGGADYATYALVGAELGRHCGSTALAYNMHAVSMLWSGPIADDLPMTDEQRVDHERRRAGIYDLVLNGDALFAQPFSEPNHEAAAGRAPFGTTAKRVDGGWEVSGRKHFASLSGHATHYGILCTEEIEVGEPSMKNTTYLAVPADTDGFEVAGEWNVLGMRATMSRNLLLDKVFVPEDLQVMPSGVYYEAASDWPHMFMTLSPTFLGIAEEAVDFTVSYLRGEVEGAPKATRSSATKQLAVAELRIEVEMARALFLRAISEAGYKPTRAARMRALACHRTLTKTVVSVTAEALRICGGRALFKHFPVERMYRDARAGAVMLPWTADICIERIGRMSLYQPGERDV